MTGTVTFVSGKTGSGAIRSAAGESFDFDLTAVLAYDVTSLAEGQPVHFELASGASRKAVNISIDPRCGIPTGKDRDREMMRLRYMGFEHRGNVRSYCFQRLTPGQQAQTFSVDADLLLFQTYQVRIQEGPALCLQLLSVGLESAGDPQSLVRYALTGQHMSAFLASHPARAAKHGPRNSNTLPGHELNRLGAG